MPVSASPSLLEGKFEEAAVEAQDDAAEWARLLVVAMARWSQKRIPEADAALVRLTEGFADIDAYHIAEVYAYRGGQGPGVRMAGASAQAARLGPNRPAERSFPRKPSRGPAVEFFPA